MSFHVPFRSFNRSQRARINGATPTATTSVFANLDSPRVQRDLARHSAIGSLVQAGDGYGFTSDGYLQDGLTVAKVTGSLNLAVGQGRVVRANGTQLTVAAVTGTPAVIGAGGATGPRIDVVCVDTSGAGVIAVVAGTAAGVVGANLFNKLSLVADLPANRIPIALVLVPTSAANLDAATLVQLR